MFQSWQRLLFAHWEIPADQLRPRVPAPLTLDTYQGRAWIALTPFLVTDLAARGLPPVPGLSEFPEMNLRTYVTHSGKPGVFFFSLDAANTPAVLAARAFYRLPYHRATMDIRERDGWIHYRSRRADSDAEFVGRYRAIGETFEPAPGTLEHFLTERYALYAVLRNGRVLIGEIHHRPWLLQAGELQIERNTVPSATAGIALPETPPLVHYSSRQDTLIWPPYMM
jgi:uncharacterized protein YqjF (DUF2071 family)